MEKSRSSIAQSQSNGKKSFVDCRYRKTLQSLKTNKSLVVGCVVSGSLVVLCSPRLLLCSTSSSALFGCVAVLFVAAAAAAPFVAAAALLLCCRCWSVASLLHPQRRPWWSLLLLNVVSVSGGRLRRWPSFLFPHHAFYSEARHRGSRLSREEEEEEEEG